MRSVLFSSFLLFLLFPALIFAQRDSLRRAYLDADSWFLFEEYADALPLYEALLESDPGNDNLNYKIGICLLNDPYQKHRAIEHLLDASENINPAYRPNNLKERAAPPDALYYLGNAYLVNEMLDRAIESFEEFLEVMDHEVYDEELVLAQIQSCKNAQRLKQMPVDIDLFLLDSVINTTYPDIRPVISGNGKKMAFVTKLPFYDAAFVTEKLDHGWSPPRMITQMLGFDSDVYPVALSYDGSEMILYYDDDYIGNLYYSRMENGQWTPATKLSENISTKYWESHACFSKDGQSLYFTSNRKGGHGDLDIYRTEKQSDGKWGTPVNLGNVINTRYNEESPYISEDGQCLYFSSYGHYNIGGYDIFCSKRNADGSWAEPVNLGYPINTTDDDLYFQALGNGNAAYYAVYSPRGIGKHDIYRMNIYSDHNPRLYRVSGSLLTEDGRQSASPLRIIVVDAKSGDTLEHMVPGEDGGFELSLTRGSYVLHFSGEGYEDLMRPLEITAASEKQGIRLDEALLLAREVHELEIPREVQIFEGEDSKIRIMETEVEQMAGQPLNIPVVVVGSLPEDDSGQGEEAEQGDVPELGEDLDQESAAEPFVEADAEDPEKAGLGMGDSPGPSPELSLIYEKALLRSEGISREILEALDLQGSGINETGQLTGYLDNELKKKGMSKKEREEILSRLFEEQYSDPRSDTNNPIWFLVLLLVVAAGGLLLLLSAARKRREKGDAQGN